jgi:hypothetical protein
VENKTSAELLLLACLLVSSTTSTRPNSLYWAAMTQASGPGPGGPECHSRKQTCSRSPAAQEDSPALVLAGGSAHFPVKAPCPHLRKRTLQVSAAPSPAWQVSVVVRAWAHRKRRKTWSLDPVACWSASRKLPLAVWVRHRSWRPRCQDPIGIPMNHVFLRSGYRSECCWRCRHEAGAGRTAE